MGLVFVNYRTNERTLGPAAIYRELVAQFGVEQVFQDYVSLRPGQMYPAGLRQALARANILITVIGLDWLTMTDDHGVRLLDRQEDWVRYEISVALARGITVIPVLMNGAKRLEAARLPADIRQLANAQAVEVHDRNLDKGLAALVAECQAAGVLPAPRPRPPRWRSRVVVAAAAVIVVGAAAALIRPWQGHDGDAGAVLYHGPISFEISTDLDQVPPPDSDLGGTWGMDIYFPVPTRLEPGPGAAIVSWGEDSAPNRAYCANLLAGAAEEKPVVALEAGDGVCVRTDEDEVAYVKFTGLSGDRYTFDATVWKS